VRFSTTIYVMFRAISSLLLFGALSPVAPFTQPQEMSDLITVASPPVESRISVLEDISASGALVIDIDSGKVIYSYAADLRRPMGSLAKIMTAIVILEERDLNEVVVVPKSAQEVEGNVARLLPGERYTVRDLLLSVLIASANDAAHTLAIHHSGGIASFADVMNERAKILGLKKTHFDNPIGFDSTNQYSTPRELAWLSLYALKNETIKEFTSKRSATIQDLAGEHTITVHSTNRLLSSHPSHFFGLKTGTTDGAGQCLISLAYEKGKPYLLVVLKSSDRYEDTLRLFRSISASSA
jgi:serine-type D-Ala-D-Ala carboxypeptidase (penicillin-binding protein 5/6)